MARDISELGADVYDDSPKPKRRFSPKKRNYIIGLSISGVLLVGAIVGSVIACNTFLLDYSNLSGITYYYTPKTFLDEGQEPTAVLYNLKSGVNYPSTFRIPSRIKGYKVVGVADNAFVGHNEIKKVIMPNTLEFVGEKAFYNCENLESFTWSKKLNKVGVDAFLNTKFYTNLTKASKTMYDLPSGLLIYVSKDYFQPYTAIVSDEITDAEIQTIKTKYSAQQVIKFGELNVNDICSGAFKDNDKICYIDLPKNLTVIANSTFENCSNLKGLDSSHCQVEEINKRAFAYCSSLVDINLPNDLKVVGDEAFMGTALVDNIPDFSEVIDLGDSIFADCEELKRVVYKGSYIPDYTFSGCTSLKEIVWGDNNNGIDEIDYIGMGAFQSTGFESFIVPKNISSISDETFLGCSELEKVSLWGNPNYKVANPEDIEDDETIDDEDEDEDEPEEETGSFIGYDGVERSGVMAGISSIKASAFAACPSLKTIDLYNDSYEHFLGEENEFTFPASLTRTDTYTTISGADNYTFAMTDAKKLNIHANIRAIGSYAFSGSKTLEEVVITQREVSRLERIKAHAFEDCTNLKEFILPSSVTELGAGIFRNCESLEDVALNNTKAKALNEDVFYNCQSLKHLDIPTTITAIKTNAFYQNYKLDYLIIPNSITQVQAKTFTKARNDETKMPIYLDFTVSEASSKNFAGGIGEKQTWHDDSVEVYYKLLAGEEAKEGYKYWNGDYTNPHAL